jgi:hypothetical protein
MRRVLAAALSLALVSSGGCATQLAPAYDQAVSTGLVSANNDIQALFVSVGSQVSKDTYASRQPAYDHIVAELNAVELEIKARPTPNPDALESAQKLLTRMGVRAMDVDPGFSEYPSARAVDRLVVDIQTMQAADQKAGLRGDEVKAFENEANTFLSQAVAYENFLKR